MPSIDELSEANRQLAADNEDLRAENAELVRFRALVARIHAICDRTIKAGQLDGDCPAYDIRHLCAAELDRAQPPAATAASAAE